MAITYPLTFPTGLAPSAMTLVPNDVVAEARSPFTGQQQVQRHQGQWWVLTMDYPVLSKDLLDLWAAALLRLKGNFGTFTFGDPSKATPTGPMGGTPVVDGGSQTGDYINIRGATHNITGWAKAGDYIQVGTALYRLTADANTDGSGKASLEVWPQVRQSPGAPLDGATVITTNTVGVFRLDKSTGWKVTPPVLGAISITAHEAL